MYVITHTAGRIRHGYAIGTLVAIAASIVPGFGKSAEVGVRLELDEAFVEVIRGIRRTEGIDPPDSAADERLTATLERLRTTRSDKVPASSARIAPLIASPHAHLISY